jgi:hypothetical protein
MFLIYYSIIIIILIIIGELSVLFFIKETDLQYDIEHYTFKRNMKLFFNDEFIFGSIVTFLYFISFPLWFYSLIGRFRWDLYVKNERRKQKFD